MNYKRIYITGLDFSYFSQLYVDSNNHVKNVERHFYDADVVVGDYNENGEIEEGQFYLILERMSIALKQFYNVRLYAKNMGVDIVNLNKESYVDAFVKGDL